MANVLVENTREHPIDLNFKDPKTEEAQIITVPSAIVANNEKQNGWIEVDEAQLKLARANKGVEAYFTAGYLVLAGKVAAKE